MKSLSLSVIVLLLITNVALAKTIDCSSNSFDPNLCDKFKGSRLESILKTVVDVQIDSLEIVELWAFDDMRKTTYYVTSQTNAFGKCKMDFKNDGGSSISPFELNQTNSDFSIRFRCASSNPYVLRTDNIDREFFVNVSNGKAAIEPAN